MQEAHGLWAVHCIRDVGIIWHLWHSGWVVQCVRGVGMSVFVVCEMGRQWVWGVGMSVCLLRARWAGSGYGVLYLQGCVAFVL
ncbi:hypothetical protein GJAV_G00154600 [Gymnothorax javanicus]|nr:hypothetical protein GJAV_G00154600 [Gymnothorax javanicus]